MTVHLFQLGGIYAAKNPLKGFRSEIVSGHRLEYIGGGYSHYNDLYGYSFYDIDAGTTSEWYLKHPLTSELVTQNFTRLEDIPSPFVLNSIYTVLKDLEPETGWVIVAGSHGRYIGCHFKVVPGKICYSFLPLTSRLVTSWTVSRVPTVKAVAARFRFVNSESELSRRWKAIRDRELAGRLGIGTNTGF